MKRIFIILAVVLLLTGCGKEAPEPVNASLAEQLREVLPDLTEALALSGEKEPLPAEELSIGQPIKLYRLEKGALVPGDYDVYPIFYEDTIVYFINPVEYEPGRYTFTAEESYGELEVFIQKMNAEKIAMIVDCDGIYAVSEKGNWWLMNRCYTGLEESVQKLNRQQIAAVTEDFSPDTRIG